MGWWSLFGRQYLIGIHIHPKRGRERHGGRGRELERESGSGWFDQNKNYLVLRAPPRPDHHHHCHYRRHHHLKPRPSSPRSISRWRKYTYFTSFFLFVDRPHKSLPQHHNQQPSMQASVGARRHAHLPSRGRDGPSRSLRGGAVPGRRHLPRLAKWPPPLSTAPRSQEILTKALSPPPARGPTGQA